MLGQLLSGRYYIISHLGQGGFGQTYLAEDRHLPGKPRCVVKQLKPKSTETLMLQTARRLFEREAEALYKLGNHDRIPRLFAHFEENQEFYLVQEFIEGTSLSIELIGGWRLCEEEAIALLRDILEVLAFVHNQQVIHRDIKPSNLIRRRSDKKIVLIDFGAVKDINNQLINDYSETSFTIAIGSPGYMPNEQIAGKPRFSSDIYAVGAIAIQSLTGIHPKRLPEDIKTGELIWRNQVEISPDLADILDKMVRYDFRERYQSASEVLQALKTLKICQDQKSSERSTPEQITFNPERDDLLKTRWVASDLEVHYTRLQKLLAAGKWQEADQETNDLILQIARCQTKGWLRVEDIENLSCQYLRTINRLWVVHSQGRFGFSVQKRIWQNIGGKKEADYLTLCRFGDAVGWRVQGAWTHSSDLTFSLDAPLGHLPACFCREEVMFGEAGVIWLLGILFARVDSCQLHEDTCLLPKFQPEMTSEKKKNNSATNSDQEVDYTKLKYLLAAGKWRDADVETLLIMLKISGRETDGWLRKEDLENFPCTELNTLDDLWRKYSNGHFGFGVQNRIWQRIEGHQAGDWKIFCRLGDRLGWRIQNSWLAHSKLNFSLEAPEGHLPCPVRNSLSRTIALFSRIAACQLHEPTPVPMDFQTQIFTEQISEQRELEYTQFQEVATALKTEVFTSQISIHPPAKFSSVINRVSVIQGDITQLQVDAIVNGTDRVLSKTGVVSRAIHRAAGLGLQEACRLLNRCETGTAKITNGYSLPARWVIHTVGPIWEGGDRKEDERLAECYRNCLNLAELYDIRTIAFPSISTGNFGFPIYRASRVAVTEIKNFLETNTFIENVIFVCFTEATYDSYLAAVAEIIVGW